MRRGRGASLLEFGVVMLILAVLMGLLLTRLGDATQAARRTQLRMAAEQVRLHAQGLMLRCGTAFDVNCWQRWLAERRAAPGQPERPEPGAPALSADAAGLLHVVALAAGLYARGGDGQADRQADWLVHPLSATRLEAALRARPSCRFILERDSNSGWVVATELTDC